MGSTFFVALREAGLSILALGNNREEMTMYKSASVEAVEKPLGGLVGKDCREQDVRIAMT
jgi:hypothetical protein